VDLEPFLVEAHEGVSLTWACGGRLEVGGADEGVALLLDLVGEEAVMTFAAATAVAREELGGEANGTGRDVAGGVGVAPKAGVLMGVDGFGEVALGGMAPGDCLFELRLLWGGVVLHWAGVPAGLSKSMGETLVVRIVDAVDAYDRGVVVGVVAASWEAGEGSVSIGVGGVSLVHLEAAGLPVVGGGQGRVFLEGPAFWPRAMVEERVLPRRLWVWCDIQERVLVVYC